jgi:NAD-dependent SIR2 family protein deacetylase
MPDQPIDDRIREAARIIRSARHLTAFTGAGISVDSGIPPFRGSGGLGTKYDPRLLEIRYFLERPRAQRRYASIHSTPLGRGEGRGKSTTGMF